jgi:hypothetical protein
MDVSQGEGTDEEAEPEPLIHAWLEEGRLYYSTVKRDPPAATPRAVSATGLLDSHGNVFYDIMTKILRFSP